MKLMAALIPLVRTKRRGVINVLIVTLVGAMASPTVNAGGHFRSSCFAPVVHRRVEVVKKIEPVYAFQQIPLYSLSYAPVSYNSAYNVAVAQPYAAPFAAQQQLAYQQPYQQQAAYQQPVAAPAKVLSCDEKLAAFEARMTALIDKRLTGNVQVNGNGQKQHNGQEQYYEQPKNGNGYDQRLPQQIAGISAKKCASCHDSRDNGVKGGGHIFFTDGVADEWSAETRLAMMKAVVQERMPKQPSPKLTPEELSEIVEELSQTTPAKAPTNGEEGNGNGNGQPPRETGYGRKQ